jgi:hypothetical protein
MSVLFLVAVFVCAFASRANAQGTVTWTSGYPHAGASSGAIVGQGVATPDSGWALAGGSGCTVTYWPQGGGVQQTGPVIIDSNGNWSFTINGLTPGATYNIYIEVTFRNQQTNEIATVSPDPATATAAP